MHTRRLRLLPLLLALAFAVDEQPHPHEHPETSTTCGSIRGKVVETENGRCDAYLGIPFAAPPVGNLRFEKPQPGICWTGVLDATEFAPICIQDGSNGTEPRTESEDCLYLNVFVPKSHHQHSHEKYPVMVFIHGGGFTEGSAKGYGVDGICDNLASRRVIVVTVQYRLFLYGFLSTGEEGSLGNLALWDQIASLEWVTDNIESFGGDLDRITIFGESAGAASVSLLTYTPVAEDLFHRSIAESGYARGVQPVLTDQPVVATTKLAVDAGCGSHLESTPALLDCLRQLSTSDLQRAYNSHKPPSGFMGGSPWTPRVDGELFNQTELRELDTRKPAIIGVNSMEFPPIEQLLPYSDKLINDSLDSIFKGTDETTTFLKRMARFLYVDAKGDRTDKTFLCQQYSALITDTTFRTSASNEAASKLKAGSPVWMYIFDYYSKNVFPSDYKFEKGAPHAHELCFLFLKPLKPDTKEGQFTCPRRYEGHDRTVAHHMGEMWTNFAIHGDPSPKSLTWPQFRNITSANVMRIGTSLSIAPEFYVETSNFWNQFVPSTDQSDDAM